jgi:hypothetical protein
MNDPTDPCYTAFVVGFMLVYAGMVWGMYTALLTMVRN